jgi:hypothetical protein
VSNPQVLDEGSYDLYFTRANGKSIQAGPIPLDLDDGTVQTLVFTDDPGTGELTLLPLDDGRD